jgi:hypothetical protein
LRGNTCLWTHIEGEHLSLDSLWGGTPVSGLTLRGNTCLWTHFEGERCFRKGGIIRIGLQLQEKGFDYQFVLIEDCCYNILNLKCFVLI